MPWPMPSVWLGSPVSCVPRAATLEAHTLSGPGKGAHRAKDKDRAGCDGQTPSRV